VDVFLGSQIRIVWEKCYWYIGIGNLIFVNPTTNRI
jgi:hypothetical protein